MKPYFHDFLGNNILDEASGAGHTVPQKGAPLAPDGPWLPRGFESLSGLHTLARKRVVLMPMQVFVDESGGKGQGPWIILVGVMGKAEDWAAFADRWRAELDRPPAIRSLHMKDAANLGGSFKGWSIESRNERVFALASLVNDYHLTAISSDIDVSAYEEIIGRRPRRSSAKSDAAKVGKTWEILITSAFTVSSWLLVMN